ncbi:thymidine phosphorylase family protein [Ramlibacter sp. AN1015]|uniref:thymidine phosphorylase family protein n=1 Tax=Ramlibacter sp. AN1015 TaxID=3133428 RepID=UPI0030C5F40E
MNALAAMFQGAAGLIARRAGIHTYQAPVVYMRSDCEVCRSEGFEAQARVEISCNGRTVIATLHHVLADWLGDGEAALSEAAWLALALKGGEMLAIRHPPVLESERHIRSKVYGTPLDYGKLRTIMQDVASARLSDLHLASFVTACAGGRMSGEETVALTRSMIDVGERLSWPFSPIVDKHCVGGLPGNRTTPLVVSIVTACGLSMPKTSSRAITSPAGTADTMETLAPVNLDLQTMRRVVEKVGGCIVWGGAVQLSPADDVLIRVQRPLDLDGTSQLVASVLSKKAAAGSARVLIDIPVGPTAKVRSREAAEELGALLQHVGGAIGLQLRILQTDGSQPVGRGIGPALEARDVVAVLQRDARAPVDLRERGLLLAGHLLELGGKAAEGAGYALAQQALDSGRAWSQFVAICEAQGGMREPPAAPHVLALVADATGTVTDLDNRKLAMVAKLCGAPASPAAGITVEVKLGQRVERGQPLLHMHAATMGEMEYARTYAVDQPLFTIGETP